MTVTAESELIQHIECLPQLPMIAHKIQSMADAPNVSAEHVGTALRHDPAIASKVLRVANSPFYAVRGEVTQVTRAVVILGARAIRNLVLGICARNSLLPASKQTEEHMKLWMHSIAVAAVCDLIARRIGFSPPEEAFLAGLLHDAGKLAMATADPVFMQDALCNRTSTDDSLIDELAHFGIDHGQAGFQILKKWGLPESFCVVAGRHHDPELTIGHDGDRLVAMAVVADGLVPLLGYGADSPVYDPARTNHAAEMLGLSVADQSELIAPADKRIREGISMLAGDAGGKLAALKLADFKKAVWYSTDPGVVSPSQAMLEAKGCEVLRTDTDEFLEDIKPTDVVFIDMPADACELARQVMATLAMQGHTRVITVADASHRSAGRSAHPQAGGCHLPACFTAFDLAWASEQWKT